MTPDRKPLSRELKTFAYSPRVDLGLKTADGKPFYLEFKVDPSFAANAEYLARRSDLSLRAAAKHREIIRKYGHLTHEERNAQGNVAVNANPSDLEFVRQSKEASERMEKDVLLLQFEYGVDSWSTNMKAGGKPVPATAETFAELVELYDNPECIDIKELLVRFGMDMATLAVELDEEQDTDRKNS